MSSSGTGGWVLKSFNDDSSILNSLLVNAWVNGLRLLVHQDPSTLVKTYEYNIDDNSLDSLGRVNIYDS